MAFIFANNVSDVTTVAIAAGDTTITVSNGDLFPDPDPYYDEFVIVVRDPATGVREIMYCDQREYNVLSVLRAREGTTAQSFPVGAQVTMPITAGILEYLRDL
jgi:hypothetical protein